MVLTYKQCLEKYGSDHLIKKEIAAGKLFQKEKGIYSLKKNCSELEIISVKYPRAIISGESAFYYHGLTDVIPDYYYLATLRTDARIKDYRVVQTFLKKEIFDMGRIKTKYQNTEINIYSLERMLIELMRFRSRLPFDYYKEIILSYRGKVEQMDIAKVEEYAEKFRNTNKLMEMIQMEVL
ncbi:MAG: hypothetical protein IJN46_07260 [Lachnospiraceae bacterium]|nr:hypothetical protein [Lachnospiraceae bacterium]